MPYKSKSKGSELECLDHLTKLEERKKSLFICENCHADVNSIVAHETKLWCWRCHDESKGKKLGEAASVIGDECDVYLRHGLCNEDGSPKRYRSKEEIKRVAFEKGLFQGGDTPKVNQRLQEAKLERYERKD